MNFIYSFLLVFLIVDASALGAAIPGARSELLARENSPPVNLVRRTLGRQPTGEANLPSPKLTEIGATLEALGVQIGLNPTLSQQLTNLRSQHTALVNGQPSKQLIKQLNKDVEQFKKTVPQGHS